MSLVLLCGQDLQTDPIRYYYVRAIFDSLSYFTLGSLPLSSFQSSANTTFLTAVITRNNVRMVRHRIASGYFDPNVELLMQNSVTDSETSLVFFSDFVLKCHLLL